MSKLAVVLGITTQTVAYHLEHPAESSYVRRAERETAGAIVVLREVHAPC